MPIAQKRLIDLLTAARQCADAIADTKLAITNEMARFVSGEQDGDFTANAMALIIQRLAIPTEAAVTIRLETERIERTRERNERYSIKQVR